MMEMTLGTSGCADVYGGVTRAGPAPAASARLCDENYRLDAPSQAHMARVIGDPWGAMLGARVPRACIPYRGGDKSRVNKAASTETLFMTALSTRPVPPAQLWSHTHTHTHTEDPSKIDVPI